MMRKTKETPIRGVTKRDTVMKKTLLLFAALPAALFAQEYPKPAPATHPITLIMGGAIHTAAGRVIEDGALVMENGLIKQIGSRAEVKPDPAWKVIDASGKHIYPGLIA